MRGRYPFLMTIDFMSSKNIVIEKVANLVLEES
jgi:hypothetical protein